MTDNIEALERAVIEANAKLAEMMDSAGYRPELRLKDLPGEMALALAERRHALSALTAAKQPKKLTAEEALSIYGAGRGLSDLHISEVLTGSMQAVLDAAHERAFRVIEAELSDTMHSPYIIDRIRRVLMPENGR